MAENNQTAAIILASGFSKRFKSQCCSGASGMNKLLLPFHGKPLARYALELVSSFDFSAGIFFVAASDAVAALAGDLPGIRVIKNSAPEKGQRESVRLGVEAAAGAEAGYYMFFVCDQPFLDADTVGRILDERQHGFIVEPSCREKPGNPCLFSEVFRVELLSLKDGETPRLIKNRHKDKIKTVELANPLVLEDIDDKETLRRLSGFTIPGEKFL